MLYAQPNPWSAGIGQKQDVVGNKRHKGGRGCLAFHRQFKSKERRRGHGIPAWERVFALVLDLFLHEGQSLYYTYNSSVAGHSSQDADPGPSADDEWMDGCGMEQHSAQEPIPLGAGGYRGDRTQARRQQDRVREGSASL